MTRRMSPRLTRMLVTWLMAAGCVSLATLVWFGYRAVQEWQRSQELLADRRARQTVDLLATALRRDMRGVQETVLASDWTPQSFAPPYEVRDVVASAFARYPYPESFFAWQEGSPDDGLLFFNRSDRPPAWMPPDDSEDPFPVSIRHNPTVARMILGRVRSDVREGRRFSTFEIPLARTRYQMVARLFYRDPFRERVDRVVGFTVDLSWVREHYFPAMAREVTRIQHGGTLAIVDDRGAPLGGVTPAASGPIIRRWFPVMFFDPLLVGVDSPADLSRQAWAVQVRLDDDVQLMAAIRGANQTLVMAAVAVAALAFGLVLTARAARDSARLADMRSEFVSTVTHELKTPIATIRAVGDTLVRGRISDSRAAREYAQLVVQEAKRLTRLVENLLAYARITDVTEVYAFEPLVARQLVDETLKEFAAPLAEAGFDVQTDVPPDLPPIRGDRTALRLALDNLVDNAIRYSGSGRWLGVRAYGGEGGRVVLEIRDRGVGIPADEIGRVTRRFYRGRGPRSPGSGLGLAIVERVATDHDGALTISSSPGEGTTVRLQLPALETDDENAHSDR